MTSYSKITEKRQSSAKNNSNMMNSFINTANALNQIKTGETGGQRLMGIFNILRNATKGN